MGVNQWNTGSCCGQNAGCNNTSAGTSKPCCTTCGLTIDPSGNAMPPSRPQPRRRPGCRNANCGGQFIPWDKDCGCQNQGSCGNTACSNNVCGECTCQQSGCNACGNQNNGSCQNQGGNQNKPCSQPCGGNCSVCGSNPCCCQQTPIQPRQDLNWTQRSGQAFPAMVYVEDQPLEGLLTVEDALQTGTLFPELVKPMNAVAGYGKKACTSYAQRIGFAAWEVRLYLHTHPNDPRALQLWNQLCEHAGGGSYATAFLNGCTGSWNWIQDPWPWEYQAQPCCNN